MLLVACLAIFAPLALALSISFAVTPEQIERGEVHVAPECTLRRILGHPCPTCGLTRAFAAISHGRIDDAAGYNRAGAAIYALWCIGTAAALLAALRAGVLYVGLRRPHSADFSHNSARAPEART